MYDMTPPLSCVRGNCGRNFSEQLHSAQAHRSLPVTGHSGSSPALLWMESRSARQPSFFIHVILRATDATPHSTDRVRAAAPARQRTSRAMRHAPTCGGIHGSRSHTSSPSGRRNGPEARPTTNRTYEHARVCRGPNSHKVRNASTHAASASLSRGGRRGRPRVARRRSRDCCCCRERAAAAKGPSCGFAEVWHPTPNPFSDPNPNPSWGHNTTHRACAARPARLSCARAEHRAA